MQESESIPPEPAQAVFPPVSGEEEMLIREVLDGDTITAYYLVPVSIRIHGINAPEITGKEKPQGLLAREFLRSLVKAGSVVRVRLHGADKYSGRVLGDVVLPDGSTVGQEMLRSGHAKPYDGKGPKPA